MYAHILITGGAGFVGSTLALRLKQEFPDATITAFDNLHRRGSELNLSRLAAGAVRFVHGDIRSAGDFEALPSQPDLLIECSAEPSAQAGYDGSPRYLIDTNLAGCFQCLELARRSRADFIFLSTSRVYPYPALNNLRFFEDETRFTLAADQSCPGASAHGISEQFPLDGPRSLYGMTKLAAELMVEEYSDAYGMRTIIDRFGLLTGPWQMAKSDQGVLALWMAAHYFERPLSYIGFGGTGKQVRDFLHIDDFCDLIVLQIRNFSLYQGRLFNAGGGASNTLSLLETTRLCAQITGKSIAVAAAPQNRPADLRIYISDHRLITSISGWYPRRDGHKTLSDTYDWIHAHEATLAPLFFGR